MPLGTLRSLLTVTTLSADSDYEEQYEALDAECRLLEYQCDGRCGRRPKECDILYLCDSCLDIGFCDLCMTKLKNGTLPMKVCSANHTFFKLYPSPEEFHGIAAVEVNGKMVLRREWLEKLKKEWKIA